MIKLFVRLRRLTCRTIFGLETFVLRCINNYRRPIVRIVHPVSAAALLLVVGFFTVYELIYILPELCSESGLFYRINCVLAVFLLHNVVGNMLYCWLTDTRFATLPKERLNPLPTEAHLWHLCTHCQMLVPPRAWHCRLCNCCILKRDHHCNVTANCIGHANQRYFIVMLLYLAAGAFVACAYNTVHMWRRHGMFGETIAYYGLSPRSANHSPHAYAEDNMQWLIINGAVLKLNVLCVILAGAHLMLQLYMIMRGSCMYGFRDRSYDVGAWRNVRLVLGDRWPLSLLSPFVRSSQPHDGTQWHLAMARVAKKPA